MAITLAVDELDTLNKAFAAICGRARSAERGLNVSLQTMGDVLAEIYNFGYELRKHPHLYEQFVLANSRQRTPLGKKARENNWHPLIHIAFSDEDREGSDLSRYARSMMYIFASKAPNQDTREFIAKHGRLNRFLTIAADHLRQEGEEPSTSSVPPAPPPVASVTPPVIGSSPVQSPLTAQPLAELHTALRGLLALTDEEFVRPSPREAAVASRAFVLANTARGCSVMMVARKRTFVCGEACLRAPISELGDTAYYLDDASAKWFTSHFSAAPTGWFLVVDNVGARLCSGHGVEVIATALDATSHGNDLRCEGFLVRASEPLDVTHVEARTVDRWRRKRASWLQRHRSGALETWHLAEQRRQYSDGHGQPGSGEPIRPIYGPFRAAPMPPMPTMFDLRCQNGELQVGYFDQLRIAGAFLRNEYMVLARVNAPVAVHGGRWLKQEDVRKLRKTLMDCPQGAQAWFVDGDIPHCALVIEGTGKSVAFRVVFPLANTLTGDRAPACARWVDKAIVPVKPVGSELAAPEIEREEVGGASSLETGSTDALGARGDIAAAVRRQFGAYITCYRPKGDDASWFRRLANLKKQITWWATKTDVSLYLNLSGWKLGEVEDFINDKAAEMRPVLDRVVAYDNPKAQPLINNRIRCLEKFYASEHRWGIMLDDDAVLSDDAHHNSSWRLFAEMAENGLDRYAGVDVFFPINPAKSPWGLEVNGVKDDVVIKPENAERHHLNHVFTANTDLKGSMFVVRNFRLEDRPVVLPDSAYTSHGEDTYFAMLAISMGYSVRRCNNIILKELTLPRDSYFGEPNARRDAMREGNERLVELFGHRGLRMKQEPDHLLDKGEFIRQCLGGKPQPLDVPKPL